MSTLEFRAVIKFLVKDRVDLKATMDKMKSVYGNECPSDSFIKYWHREFKCGRVSIEDEPRSGRPTEIDYSNLAPKIKAAIEENRKCDLNSLALKYNVSYGVIQKIVTKDLGMRKLTTKWIPHVLSVANKQERVKCCVANLDLYNKQPNAFLKCLVTMDETWVLQSTPETRTEASEWVDDPDKVSKRPRHSQNVGKAMLCVWWDSKGILLAEWCDKGSTINGDHYRKQLDKVHEILKTKRSDRPKRKPLFLQDNARPHKAQETMKKIKDLGWKIIDHPPYSPDLAPSDFFLFSNLKRFLRGRSYETTDTMKLVVQQYLEERPEEWFLHGLARLPDRWEACIDKEGDYVQ
ncbi:Histone-lysine N-methyltransferase SETMAR [Anthophora quadrimaculata]